MKKFVIGLAAACMLMFSSAQAGLIVNGGFEDPVLPYQTWEVFQTIPGWATTSGPGIEVQNNVAGSPYEGNQFVELDSHANSSMEQLINTIVGQEYTLEFYYSPRPGEKRGTNNILVGWGNMSLGAIGGSGVDNPNTVWERYTYNVIGQGVGTSLNFRALGVSDSYGGYLDNVSLATNAAPVPEPATMLLFGTGITGLIGVARKRKEKGQK